MNASYSTAEFEKAFTYHGDDLGFVWSPKETHFRLWAPTARAAAVKLYASGTPGADDLICQIPMTADRSGTWIAHLNGDWNKKYYTYLVDVDDRTIEACDPYAKAAGVNGRRAMILDMESTNPAGWKQDANPNSGKNYTDAVIYELHVRDLSIDSSSGISQKGLFGGVAETGAKTASGLPTGLDHMKQLGITHLHLLPVYDYGSVDESHPEKPQFNWGYDPVNYNVPEGSYSSDPFHGEVRVAEMKQMIHTLHQNGISVIMDVVYNHVYRTAEFCFNQFVPDYFSRFDQNGKYSNGSACGNDTASERSMVHKYIVDSVNYWADEYHIDGFRFDLVGLIDADTINDIVNTVHDKHPDVIFYGEGWDIPSSVTKPNLPMAIQRNAPLVPNFAFFNDTIRDCLRGSVFIHEDLGYICGKPGQKTVLENCFRGVTHWTKNPQQIINYASCHDNHTLFDRITVALPKAPYAERVQRNNLAAAFVLLSQGIPFIHAGEELLRSKPGKNGDLEHNSYRSPDCVNAIKWNDLDKAEVQQTLAYYKGLIALRKAYPSLRMTDPTVIAHNVIPIPCTNEHMLAFLVYSPDNRLLIAFNADTDSLELKLPSGTWDILVQAERAGTVSLGRISGKAALPALSALVLCQKHREQ